MRVIDPGHAYKLDWLDGFPENAPTGSRPNSSMSEDTLIFVKREGEKYPGNIGHHAGTNLQEVLRACIARVKYVDNQESSVHNERVLKYLRCAIAELEERAAHRHGREFEPSEYDVRSIETYDTCSKCGHIGCEGECHP